MSSAVKALLLPPTSSVSRSNISLGMFRVLLNIRLDKDRRFLWVDSRREINSGKVEGFLTQRFRVLRQRDRVQIYDAVQRLVVVLQRDPILERTEIITDVKFPGRLRTAENAFFLRCHAAGPLRAFTNFLSFLN